MSKLIYQDIKTHSHPICFHRISRIVSSPSSRSCQDDPRNSQENQAKMSKLTAFFKIYKVKSHRSFDMSKALDKDSSLSAPENITSFMKNYLSTAGKETKKLSFTINPDLRNLNGILDIVQKVEKLQELDLTFQSSSDENSCQQLDQITKFAQQLRKRFPRLKHLNLSFPSQDNEKLNTINLSQQFFNLIAKRFSSISSLSFNSKNSSLLSHNFPSLKLARLGKELAKISNQCKKIIFDFSFQGESLFGSLQDFLRNINPSQCHIQSLKINLTYCKEIKFSSLSKMFEMISEHMPSLKNLEVDMSYSVWVTEENAENLSKIHHHPLSGSKLANLTLNFWSNVNLNDSMIKELIRSTILIQGSCLKKLSINLGKSSISSKTLILLLFEVPGSMKYLKEIVYNFSQCQKIMGNELENKEEQEKNSKRLMKLKVEVMNCRGLQMKHLQALEEKLIQNFVKIGCLVNFNMKELTKKKYVIPLKECKNKEGNKK